MSSMAQYKSSAVGVVGLGVSTEHNLPNFWDDMFRGILQGASRFDRDLTVVRSSLWGQADISPIFSSRDYAGLIILGALFAGSVFEGIDLSGLPAVTIGGAGDRPDLPSVDVDNYRSARAAIQHLIDLGHKRIAYVSLLGVTGWANERHRAYLDALTDAGIDVDDNLIVNIPIGAVAEGYEAACELLIGERPTAIATVNDDTAHGVLRRLQEMGIKVPHDIALIGFDDLLSSLSTDPPLSTVRQPKQAIGSTAFEVLMARIDGAEAPVEHITLPGELIVRASTSG